jgi:hypothetical protein
LPTYVGSLGNPTEAPVYMPRAYYTDIGIFEVLGERFAMSPILDAVDDLHQRLFRTLTRGGVIDRDRQDTPPPGA